MKLYKVIYDDEYRNRYCAFVTAKSIDAAVKTFTIENITGIIWSVTQHSCRSDQVYVDNQPCTHDQDCEVHMGDCSLDC